MFENVTAVIQGPLREILSESIPVYRELFPRIIVSHWGGDDGRALAPYFTDKQFKIIVNHDIQLPSITYKERQNELKQIFTTCKGLRQVQTDFVIKLRSDEFYEDLSPLVQMGLENPGRMTVTNIFFRPTNYLKFNPSDHILMSDTRTMLNTFEFLLEEYRNPTNPDQIIGKERFGVDNEWDVWNEHTIEKSLFCEQIIGMGYLYTKGVIPNPKYHREIMLEHFRMVPVTKLGRFVARSNSIGYNMTTWEDIAWSRPESITDMNQL